MYPCASLEPTNRNTENNMNSMTDPIIAISGEISVSSKSSDDIARLKSKMIVAVVPAVRTMNFPDNSLYFLVYAYPPIIPIKILVE